MQAHEGSTYYVFFKGIQDKYFWRLKYSVKGKTDGQ